MEPIKGSDKIKVLDGQSMSATVTDVNGNEYTYSVTFVLTVDVDEEMIDAIISGGIEDVNHAISQNGAYARTQRLRS